MNNRELIPKFKKLPDVLINKILDYTDIIVFRYGKHMNRINKNDIRYILIKNIPRPMRVGENKILLKLLNYKYVEYYGYLIYYILNDNHIIIDVKFIIRKTMCYEKYFDIKWRSKYIFDKNSRYSKLIDYSL
jgi:hypothetical protein